MLTTSTARRIAASAAVALVLTLAAGILLGHASVPAALVWLLSGVALATLLGARAAMRRPAAPPAQAPLPSPEQLRHLADHDPLTGLLNNDRFGQELGRQVAYVRRYGAEGAVLLVDLDRTDDVNASHGAAAGDALLVTVGQVLQQSLRTTDTLARRGGDVFAVLLPKADRVEAEIVGKKLVTAVREATTPLGDSTSRSVTASVGVVLLEGAAELTAEGVLIDAELATGDAKADGGDRFAFFALERHASRRALARRAWIDRIGDALDDSLALVAQPIDDARTGATLGHELLLQMAGEDGALIAPAAFAATAQERGLVSQMDRWLARRAIGLLAQRPQATTPLGIQISPGGLADDALIPDVTDALAESGVAPELLWFQLSEGLAVADLPGARAFAERVTQLGCRFALGNFGAELGDFAHLRQLPSAGVKLDGALVRRCVESPADRMMVEALVRAAHALDRRIGADGVDDAETHALMLAAGVDAVQGRYVGEPLPLAQTFLATPSPAAHTLAA